MTLASGSTQHRRAVAHVDVVDIIGVPLAKHAKDSLHGGGLINDAHDSDTAVCDDIWTIFLAVTPNVRAVRLLAGTLK